MSKKRLPAAAVDVLDAEDLDIFVVILSDQELLRMRLVTFDFFANLSSKFAVSSKRKTVSVADQEGTKENESM